jgi:NitT/TauT family transport system substrate-binding protein
MWSLECGMKSGEREEANVLKHRGQQISRLTLIGVVLVMLLGMLVGSWSCSKSDYSGKIESITFGNLPVESSELIYVALDQNYFAKNGLNVTIRDYVTGIDTLNAAIKDEVDIAGMAEWAIVVGAFQKQKISLIANIDKWQAVYIVARRDRGIENISDLKGKTVGLSRGTIVEFYLARFLDLHGMNIRDLTLVNATPSQSVDMISKSDVDAVIIWQPYVNGIQRRLRDQIVAWPGQSSQPVFGALVGKNTWITEHQDLVSRFLKSLALAEEYLDRHPTEAKAILQKRLTLDVAYVETHWPRNQFSLSLDQSVIAAMEDEARWMIKNNLTREKTIPDFMNYIYVDGLKAVKPEAVKIIQ